MSVCHDQRRSVRVCEWSLDLERLSASAANDRLHPPDTSLGVLAAPAAGRLPPDRPPSSPLLDTFACLELKKKSSRVFSGETAAPSATRPGPPHTRRAERDAPRATAHTPRSTGTAQLIRGKPHRPPSHAPHAPQSTQTPLSASAAHATAVAWPTPIARRISDAAASCTATEMRCITNGMYFARRPRGLRLVLAVRQLVLELRWM